MTAREQDHHLSKEQRFILRRFLGEDTIFTDLITSSDIAKFGGAMDAVADLVADGLFSVSPRGGYTLTLQGISAVLSLGEPKRTPFQKQLEQYLSQSSPGRQIDITRALSKLMHCGCRVDFVRLPNEKIVLHVKAPA